MTNIEPLLAAKKHIAKTEKEELHGNYQKAIDEASQAISQLEQWKSELQKEQP